MNTVTTTITLTVAYLVSLARQSFRYCLSVCIVFDTFACALMSQSSGTFWLKLCKLNFPANAPAHPEFKAE